MLKPPLLDPSVPDTQLAGWIEVHTMRAHQFLDRLDKVITNCSLPRARQRASNCMLSRVKMQMT